MAAGLTSVALIGAGRWGRQLLRVFESRCRVVQVGHRGSPETDAWLHRAYPHLARTTDCEAIFTDPAVEAVVLATPIATHARLARAALEADKHVFVEKPLATDPADARALMDLASSRRRVLFVGHVFLYHPVLERIQQFTADDPVRFAAFTWQKLGTFEEDLFWNLASHDVALALDLFGERPREAALLDARGVVTACDLASIRLTFSGGRSALLMVNRCSPLRAKQVTLTTEQGRVLAWDAARLLRLSPDHSWEEVPADREEPLVREVNAFLGCLEDAATPGPGADSAVAVVELVEQLASQAGALA